MVTYLENLMNSVNTQILGNTEPSLKGNLSEGVTTIEAARALGLAETLDLIASRAMNCSNAPMQREITTVFLQDLYNYSKSVSRKVFKTSSPTIALCNLFGLTYKTDSYNEIRKWLYSKGVMLAVGDKQCADPKTKQIKAKIQSNIRTDENEYLKKTRIERMIKSRWLNKPLEELQRIRDASTIVLNTTISSQMAGKDSWDVRQGEKQHLAALAKAAMSEERKQNAINKWKTVYWNKTQEERIAIQKKREKSTKTGFYRDGIWFGSSYESSMYDFLTKSNIQFEFQSPFNLGSYTWHADFFLPASNTILEVKGRHPQSMSYWFAVTLPAICKSDLCSKYDVKIFWDKAEKYSTFSEILEKSESVNDIVCSQQ